VGNAVDGCGTGDWVGVGVDAGAVVGDGTEGVGVGAIVNEGFAVGVGAGVGAKATDSVTVFESAVAISASMMWQ